MPTRTTSHARGAPPPPRTTTTTGTGTTKDDSRPTSQAQPFSGPHENQPTTPATPPMTIIQSPNNNPRKEPETQRATTTTTTSSTTTTTILTKNRQAMEKEKEKENQVVVSKKISRRLSLHPTLTPHRRRTYQALLSVPRGRWTTYSALAGYVHSSARAVGAAMRSNPFAPDVPCHRVLAADGSLGGYKGDSVLNLKKRKKMGTGMGTGMGTETGTGEGGYLGEKRRMLEGEGVVFDEQGRAMGVVFVDFTAST